MNNRSVRRTLVGVLTGALVCGFAVAGCADENEPSASERVAEQLTDHDRVDQFLTSDLRLDGDRVDPAATVKSWLTDPDDSDSIASALTVISASAGKSIETNTRWAQVLTKATGPVAGRCPAELIPAKSRPIAGKTATTMASGLSEWLWPRIGADNPPEPAVRLLQEFPDRPADSVKSTGSINGQPISTLWCLIRWLRMHPAAEKAAADSAVIAFNTIQRGLIGKLAEQSSFPGNNPLTESHTARSIIELARIQSLFSPSEHLRDIVITAGHSPPVRSKDELWISWAGWNMNIGPHTDDYGTILIDLISERFGPDFDHDDFYQESYRLESLGLLPDGLTDFLSIYYKHAYSEVLGTIHHEIVDTSGPM